MRRTVLVGVMLLVAILSFADEALMIPAGVLRVSPAASLGFTVAEYDASWKRAEIPEDGGRLYEMGVGASIGLGVTDWLSAEIEWTPGWNVWSSFDYPAGTNHPDFPIVPITNLENATINGPFTIYTTVKFQIIGSDAPVKVRRFRLVLAPVVKIPLPGPDWQEQADKMAAGDKYIYQIPDKHAFGVGARAYIDFILSKNFYINLFGEKIFTFGAEFDDTALWGDWAGSRGQVQYGGVQIAELEPHFEAMLGSGLKLGIGLPVTYAAIGYNLLEPDLSGGDHYWVEFPQASLLSVSPNVSLCLMQRALPMKIEIDYKLPLIGKNMPARNVLSLQVSTDVTLFKPRLGHPR